MTQSLALYRKYRPQKFSDVLGQDQIVKVLEGAVKLKRISHAYLFSGARGTGKTSLARILAREIGCLDEDLYEIDAASNRGVDDIRGIRDSAAAPPFRSPYKVFIVDEVHMLTPPAFNALLKILEEPPAYAVFILATTEMEKMPDTVLSRCQIFQFKKPSQQVLKEMVLQVAKKEGYEIKNSSAELIALLAEGSFRDAQGILQKVLSFSADREISQAEVETVVAAPPGLVINQLVKALSEKNLERALATVGRSAEDNLDFRIFLKLLLQKIRFVLLLRLKAGLDEKIKEETTPEDFEFLLELSRSAKSVINSATLLELLNAYEKTGSSIIPQLPLELALVKLCGGNDQ